MIPPLFLFPEKKLNLQEIQLQLTIEILDHVIHVLPTFSL